MLAESTNHTLLKVINLKSYFRTAEGLARAVDDISFTIKKGETFALVGESGCGKSVTALSIMQLLPQPSGYIAGGEIYLGDIEITTLPESKKREMRGDKISMIFQEPMTSLNPVFTIGYQIYEAIRLHQNVSPRVAKEITIEMLDKVGIPDPVKRYQEYPHQLSGGMKQRVMIAMALSCKPDLLIADEPSTALDVTIQAQLLNLMKDLQRDLGSAILLITHDLGVVYQMADRIGVMYAGKIVEQAHREGIFRQHLHPYTVKLFQSLPGRQKRGIELQVIEGMVPKATQFPEGCRFADRCDKTMAICRTREPELKNVLQNHSVACHLFAQKEKAVQAIAPALRSKDLQKYQSKTAVGNLIKVAGLKMYFPIKKGVFKRTADYVKAVDGVDMSIPKGQTLALVGESGCGKTTMGKCLLQLLRSTAGTIQYNGADGAVNLNKLKRAQLKPYRKKLQIIFQDPYSSLNPRMMVGEIIEEGMKAHRIGRDAAERFELIKGIMQKVGLDQDMMKRYPHEFSGGQRQRISIARALAVNPEFIVCDEPTSALDVSIQAQILNLLKELQQERGLTYLFVTHDLAVVEYLADTVAVMYLGRIVERGTVDEVFDQTKHPYTKALLAAIPKIDEATGLKRIFLEGDVPSPINPPKGCHFHPRCPEVIEQCRRDYPELRVFSDTHSVCCHLYKNKQTT